MSFNLTSSQAIIWKAGASASPTIIASGAYLARCCDDAEARLMAETRFDWITASSAISANKRHIVDEIVSCWAAMPLVSYDTSGYRSLAEAQTILDFLDDRANKGIITLKEDKSKTFLGVDAY